MINWITSNSKTLQQQVVFDLQYTVTTTV